ncbi:YraN family protein [Orbus mooreae]|uniref:YraN family protein n=1 Tax=Orbus mooreae TaxID=3074107 RepID=UPI00370D16C0
MENKRQLGKFYEEHACAFLTKQGLLLIAQNSISKLGEVDLIMQDDECLVFVEVRYRKNASYGDAQSTVTTAKQYKVIKAAYNWMQQKKIDIETSEFRFDVFAITGKESIWIKNAFCH